VLLIALLVIAVGCGSDDGAEDAPRTEGPTSSVAAEPARRPLGPTYPASECCDQAGMAGGWELAGDPSTGCVWLEALDADEVVRLSTIWPEGFTVSFDPLRVYDGDGTLFAEAGTRLGIGGRGEADPPDECRQDTAAWPGTWRIGELGAVDPPPSSTTTDGECARVPVVVVAMDIPAGTTGAEAASNGMLREDEISAFYRPATAVASLDDVAEGVAIADLAANQVVTLEHFGLQTDTTLPPAGPELSDGTPDDDSRGVSRHHGLSRAFRYCGHCGPGRAVLHPLMPAGVRT